MHPVRNGFSEEIEVRMKNDNRVLYRRLSLVALIKKIVEESDPLALKEFHDNRPIFRFRYGEKRDLRFVEFLRALCTGVENEESWGRHDYTFTELIYDLTMDKFCNLPKPSSSFTKNHIDNNQPRSRQRSDCRKPFKAFLKRISKDFKISPPASQLEAETRAAARMQGLVKHHFQYSQIEARRQKNLLWSRYNWNIDGDIIVVYLPRNISGRKRGEWLAKNIKDADPKRPNEKERIQRIIDQKLVFQAVDGLIEDLADPDTEQNQLWPKNEEQFGISLAIVVADEKARNIHEQRRSIRNLGEEKLKHLILRIFEDIKYDDYQDKEIAIDFGLSKATFSRFAGSDWAKTKSTIPDLWLNTAKVLTQHDGFKQIALKAGYLKEVETTLEKMHFLNPETD
jgi:hypothetical protein